MEHDCGGVMKHPNGLFGALGRPAMIQGGDPRDKRARNRLSAGVSLVMSLALMVALMSGVTSAPGHASPGELLIPGGGRVHVQLTSDSLSSFAPYSPGELWDQGSLVEQCAPCNLRSASGAPAGQSLQAGQEVNPATGDFNFSHQIDSVPTVGGNLGMTVTYDGNRAGNLSGLAGPVFGTGWQSTLFPTETAFSDPITGAEDFTVNEQNGSQETFLGDGSNLTCAAITENSNVDKYTVPTAGSYSTLEPFCAPYRVDAQLG